MMRKSYKFIPGIKLNKGSFFDVVRSIIDRYYLELPYSAALIGDGSDFLYDIGRRGFGRYHTGGQMIQSRGDPTTTGFAVRTPRQCA